MDIVKQAYDRLVQGCQAPRAGLRCLACAPVLIALPGWCGDDQQAVAQPPVMNVGSPVPSLIEAARNGDHGGLLALLERESEPRPAVNATNDWGISPLMAAAMEGHQQV